MNGVAPEIATPEIATEDAATEMEISKAETAKIFFIAPSPEFSMKTRFQARRRMRFPGSADILVCFLRSVSPFLKSAGKDACAPWKTHASVLEWLTIRRVVLGVDLPGGSLC